MHETITLTSIGHVVGGRADPVDDDWDQIEAIIRLDDRFTADDLQGLTAFSHIEVVYYFHHEAAAKPISGLRHPRGRTDWPAIGIFAQRAKNRPNRIGITTCRILGVEGLEVRVRGLDAIDGTPVLDLKPHMTGFAPRGDVVEPVWARELMQGYW